MPSVGILGGGQLGCMLMDAALALGLSPKILTEKTAPAAALFGDHAVCGSVDDPVALRTFLGQVDTVAFENEFLDCDLLESASQGRAPRFAPGLDALRMLQDKLRQKELMTRLGLPTAEFAAIPPGGDRQTHQRAVELAYQRFDGQVVFKWSRMGYDGKGVHLAEDSAGGRLRAIEFCSMPLARGIPVYAERRIRFRRELAIIGCRSTTGEFATYPLVVSEQVRGICRKVLGPATAMGVPQTLEAQASQAARKIAEELGIHGSFAIELFETPDGALSINEIAPRVHNSGHYTQDACPASQFENHWRAILGMPLGETRPMGGAFGMLNLLGPEDVTLQLERSRTGLPFPAVPAPLHLHWYAKTEIRPWRKVGHLNACVSSADALSELEVRFEQYHSEWMERLRLLQDPRRS